MAQTFFTGGGPKRLKIQTPRNEVAVYDETVIRWEQAGLETLKEGEKVRIAAFDLDQTLTTTKSGSVFARYGHDWRLLEHMTNRLGLVARSTSQRTIVVVFTNQGSVVPRPDAKSYANLLTKIGGVLKALPEISLVFAAAKAPYPEKRAQYRKPGRGMFKLLEERLQPGVVDMTTSFYVGDAAGRPQDHSADDRGFAEAVGLRFYTPEAWLESKDAKASSLPADLKRDSEQEGTAGPTNSSKQESPELESAHDADVSNANLGVKRKAETLAVASEDAPEPEAPVAAP